MSRDLERFIRRRVSDEHAAADVLQETFLRIHDGIEGLRDEERIVAWVHRIARNAIVDHFRRARVQHALDDDAHQEAPDDAPASPPDLNATVGGWLVDMIGSLPPDYRAALELAEGQGLEQRVVAERLGLSLSGAKSRIQRGRAMLKDQLLACCHVELDRFGNVLDYQRNRKRSGGCATCCDDADRGVTDDPTREEA